jgi:hypothetical protein
MFTTHSYPLVIPNGKSNTWYRARCWNGDFELPNIVLPLICFTSVPQEKNGYDCGLYFCRYALGVIKIRDQIFTTEDNTFSNNEYFCFDQKLINKF